jgi:hypothetical protein
VEHSKWRDRDHTRSWEAIDDAIANATVSQVDVVVILLALAEDMVQSLVNNVHFDQMEGRTPPQADLAELRHAVGSFSEQCARLVQPCFVGRSKKRDDSLVVN